MFGASARLGSAQVRHTLLQHCCEFLCPVSFLSCGPAVVRGEVGALFHWHEKEHHEQKEEAKAEAQDAAASGADSKKES